MTLETTDRETVRARVVDATAHLLREGGPSAVTTRGVAEAADVQPPTIYRLFGDKDGLLEAVAEHVMATFVATKSALAASELVANADPIEDLRAGWQRQMEFGLSNPALFRLLSDPDRAAQSAAAHRGLLVLEGRVHRIAVAGRLGVSETLAVALVHAAGIGAVHVLLSTPAEHRQPDLADTMLDAVLRQILIDSTPPAADPAVRAAIGIRAVVDQLSALTEAERQLCTEWLDRTIDS